MKTYLSDIKSGFSVFLLALPLCLGISIASQFPPIAGLITAIIGGIVCTFLGAAKLTIKGPAAGLIAICFSCVIELSQGGDLVTGYKRALAVGVFASVLQISFSIFRFARLAELIPPSVIHGMLAAIGVIILSKQIFVLTGMIPQSTDAISLLKEFFYRMPELNPYIFIIGLLSLNIIYFWPKLKKLQFIPASMVVLIFGILMDMVFDLEHAHGYKIFENQYQVSPLYLIRLPQDLTQIFTFPDFSQVFTLVSFKYIMMFALVGSIESLLTVCATDNIDPQHNVSDLDKDLFAVGVGNLFASFLGGLPMISEIVRSKANIDYGASSRWSNFFHGLFLLLALVFFSPILQMVPLAALAALLIFVGLRLASVHEMIKVLKVGGEQLLIFLLTLIVTLKTDLLVGVVVGLMVKLMIHLFRGASPKDLFIANFSVSESSNTLRIEFKRYVLFSNFLKIYILIKNNISSKNIELHFQDALLVDHATLHKIHDLKIQHPGKITLNGLETLHLLGQDEQSTRVKLSGR